MLLVAIMSSSPEEKPLLLELAPMPAQVDVHDTRDDWTGVTSTAKRRKLQNRINQRAHRRRKAQSKEIVDQKSGITTVIRNGAYSNDSSTTKKNKNACVHSMVNQFVQYAYASYLYGTPELSHLPLLIQYNVFSALACNAAMLNVSKEWLDHDTVSPFNRRHENPISSPSTPPSWPATLQPTFLQTELEHHPWIDLFPSPRMRDNFLKAIGDPDLCDEDVLCQDLCQYDASTGKATLIVWGSPWDPRSWEASPAFLRKWGFLLYGCDEILQATNYWREKRGEGRIKASEVMSAMEKGRLRFLGVGDTRIPI